MPHFWVAYPLSVHLQVVQQKDLSHLIHGLNPHHVSVFEGFPQLHVDYDDEWWYELDLQLEGDPLAHEDSREGEQKAPNHEHHIEKQWPLLVEV